jgi:hypothetical protein
MAARADDRVSGSVKNMKAPWKRPEGSEASGNKPESGWAAFKHYIRPLGLTVK